METMTIENIQLVDDYLHQAKDAYDSKEYLTAEISCDKLLKIDPLNYHAWLLKGRSVGNQGTLENNFYKESVDAFSKAIINCPSEEKDLIIAESKNEMKTLAQLMVIRGGEASISKLIFDNKVLQSIESDILIGNMDLMVKAKVYFSFEEITRSLAPLYNNIVNEMYLKRIKPDYADRMNCGLFIYRIKICVALLEKALEMNKSFDNENLDIYKSLVFFLSTALDSYTLNRELDILNETKELHQKIIQYKSKIKQLEIEELERRYKEYWESHTTEKITLEEENKSYTKKIESLRKEIESLSGKAEKISLSEQSATLAAKKSTLGIFKGKEKKVIQEQINQINTEIETITKKADIATIELKNQLTEFDYKLKANTNELTRSR